MGKKIFPDKIKELMNQNDCKDSKALRHKFLNAAWKFSFFLILSISGVTILLSESWSCNPSQYFENFHNQQMSECIRLYIIFQLAGYVYSIMLMPFEPKQTVLDQIVYFIHHVVTIGLLYCSLKLYLKKVYHRLS